MASGFKMDPKALRQIENDVAAKLQPKADRASDDAIRAVRTRMSGHGHSEAEILKALKVELRKRFPGGLQVDEAELGKLAREIEAE